MLLLLFAGAFLLACPPKARGLEGKLNINSASAAELELLPFTGTRRANAIVRYRLEKGPFESLDELLRIPDIGPSTFEAIRPYLVLSGPSTLKRREADRQQPSPGKAASSPGDATFRVLPRIVTQPGEVMLLPDRQYYDTLINFVHNADQRIDLAMFLFKISDSKDNRPAEIIRELGAARTRGVKVNITLENSGYDEDINRENGRTAETLKSKGAHVRFDGRGATSHMKIVVIDQRFCFIGSHNFTHAALTFNHEFSVLLDSPALAIELLAYITSLQAN